MADDTAPVTAEDVPSELIEILDRAAGKEHSRTGSVVACLAEILTAYRRTLTPVPVTAEGLRERLTEVLNTTIVKADGSLETATDLPWDRHDKHRFLYNCAVCRGDVPAIVAAVLAALAGDPGDLPALVAAELAPHLTPGDEHADTVCAGCQRGDRAAHLTEVAMSVRWEHAASQAAEVERQRAEIEKLRAERDAKLRTRALGRSLTEMEGFAQRETARADAAEAEVERLRAELAEASDALCAVGKAALVVAPTLAKPYPDAPKTSPWQQFMERPVRDAYNLGKRIRRELKEVRDAR